MIALVVLEGLQSTFEAEILSASEGLVALDEFSIMVNIRKKDPLHFFGVALEVFGRGGVRLYLNIDTHQNLFNHQMDV